MIRFDDAHVGSRYDATDPTCDSLTEKAVYPDCHSNDCFGFFTSLIHFDEFDFKRRSNSDTAMVGVSLAKTWTTRQKKIMFGQNFFNSENFLGIGNPNFRIVYWRNGRLSLGRRSVIHLSRSLPQKLTFNSTEMGDLRC